MNTHAVINASIWACGLILQTALLIALFRRRIARRFPLFTLLIAFYLLRSIVLFLLSSHIAITSYISLYNTLSIVDILLQISVAIEVINHLARGNAGWTLRHCALAATFLCIADIATILTTAIFPPHPPVPLDRSQLFLSFLMILLFAWTISIRSASPLLRRVILGFALYGTANLLASTGRTYASRHNRADVYEAWSYTLAAAYLAVIVLWLFTLKAEDSQTAIPYPPAPEAQPDARTSHALHPPEESKPSTDTVPSVPSDTATS
jgi:hypothetical protein